MREQILDGELTLPNYDRFITALGINQAKLAYSMFNAMWYAYLKNKGSINLTYWSDRFDNAKNFNVVLMSLSKAGWIISHSIPARNWAEAELDERKLLDYVTQEELESVRAHNKFKKYVLKEEESTVNDLTKVNGNIKSTGLVRKGFQAAGTTRFKYDTNYIVQYEEAIQKNLTKSMDKIAVMYPELKHDRASYDTISIEVLDYYKHADQVYTRGNNYSDSRGRAISDCLGKIGNPLSCKDFRALLVME